MNNARWDYAGNSLGASSNEAMTKPLEGSHRSGVVGSERGTVFIVGDRAADSKSRKVPKRLLDYQANKKTTSESDIITKQKLAEERKKKYVENKSSQARKVSQEAINFDKKVQAALKGTEFQKPENQRRWYEGALPK